MTREEIRSQLLAEQATDKKWNDGTYQVNAVHYWFERCITERLALRKVEEERDGLKKQIAGIIVKRMQPCGCIICICENNDRCTGCGAKRCSDPDCPTRRGVVEYENHPAIVAAEAKAASEYRRGVGEAIRFISEHGFLALATLAERTLLPSDNPQQEVTK